MIVNIGHKKLKLNCFHDLNGQLEEQFKISRGLSKTLIRNGTIIFQIKNNQVVLDNSSKYQFILHDQFDLILDGGLKAGKGGFGSQLKGQAAKKKKIKSTKSCRDLKGRRIRHSQNEQGLMDYLNKKKEEDQMLKKLQKQEKEVQYDQGLRELQKSQQEYQNQTNQKIDDISKSIMMGLFRKGIQKDQLKEGDYLFDVPTKRVKKTEEIKPVVKQINSIVQNDKENNHQQSAIQKIENQVVQAQQIEIQNNQVSNSSFDLNTINSEQELLNFDGEVLKNELVKLGLKCGGKLEERANRLWLIKQDPQRIYDPKLQAKKSK